MDGDQMQEIPTVEETPYMRGFIGGVPYGRFKVTGDKGAADVWTQTVIKETKDWAKVRAACAMNVTFLLPANKYSEVLPYGNDLDNLCKRFFDALSETIFSETMGGDSCVISLHVMKTKVPPNETSGAALEILPVVV